MVVGECMPDVRKLAGLGELGDVEGYLASKRFSAAMFRGRLEDGRVEVKQNMRGAFREGEEVIVIVMAQRAPPEGKAKEGGE